MNKTILASTIGLLFTTGVHAEAQDSLEFGTVLVTANKLERKDTETTYSSEIHTQQMISNSGATSLYDYLAQHTSVTTLSNFGNKITPAIDMRGYGSENGYQNIVVTVDGQRLNGIDMNPAMLGAIPLSNIDRIEITKGSGSVIYGDGAMAGTIQIYTKNRTGVSATVSAGNFGSKTGTVAAGISEQYFDLSATATDDSNDGFSKKDINGNKDKFSGTSQKIKLAIKPIDGLRLNFEGTSSRNDIRYNNSLTREQFNADPRQSGGSRPYTHQALDSDTWRIGIDYQLTENWKFTANHIQEDKLSDFFSFSGNYDYRSNDMAITYQTPLFSIVSGLQQFQGNRITKSTFGNNSTDKDNLAAFLQTEWRINDWTFSAGARREQVKYEYKEPGTKLEDSQFLNAWDVGLNYKISPQASIFSNYNSAFQAPDVDRFFTAGTFNGFINPAKAKTLNIGFNHVVSQNRLKLTVFKSWLHDEIYYFNTGDFNTSFNTNIDKSHKYGVELQDQYKITENATTSIIYTYTRAVIDRENEGDGAFNGNDLPGVAKHSIVGNIGYRFWDNAYVNLSHVWRAPSYALNDFRNNFIHKQTSYQSTNLAASYAFSKFQVFTSINNIFEHKNAIQVGDDSPTIGSIYPVDFSRTWRIGMKIDL